MVGTLRLATIILAQQVRSMVALGKFTEFLMFPVLKKINQLIGAHNGALTSDSLVDAP